MAWSHTVATESGSMECHPLTSDRLIDLDQVMGDRGVARSCYCMHWRRPDGGFGDERDNRARFADRAARGRPPGLVGYIDDVPVGWVQVGPQDEFPTILRSRLLRPIDDLPVWSINCFVVRVGHRRSGIGTGLLAAAIAYAKSEGASVVEAYPVDGVRTSAVDYFTGTLGMFSQHGFAELIRRKDSRPIVRLTL